ncbi:Oxidoreductase AflY [Leucoagaricus sp. SymC.cos]|nr:Oxidoreductase AflY [Leucoagaricus sp. SymC.cos]
MPENVDTEFLYPTPSPPPSTLSPYQWPGVSPESTQALKEVLKDNHERWHIFFNDRHYHNHAMHQAIANWSLGVDGSVIKAAYELHAKEQRPIYDSPEPITEANFEKHLGDAQFYKAYVDFYTEYARKHGIDKTLETFIFSKKYNTGKAEMLARFLSGLLHPMIHAGYGAEFGLPVMLVEGELSLSLTDSLAELVCLGLASTSVHQPNVSKLLPKLFFDSIYAIADPTAPNAPGYLTSVTGTIRNVASYIVPSVGTTVQSHENVHALTILARVAEDSKLTLPSDLDELNIVENTIADHSDVIRDYAMQWPIDLSKPGEINRKVEELSWMVVVIYGVAGWTWAQQFKQGAEGDFNADFFFVHLVTSSAFIPSIIARLSDSPHAQIALLRSYLSVALSVYVSRARPRLDIAAFFKSSSATAYPLPIHSLPTPSKDALPGQDKIETRVPDPWLPLVQTTIVHPDEHLPKVIRALATFASKFGTTTAGSFGSPEVCAEGALKTELPGAEFLDGTLFIRAAGLTSARMGRVGQGEAASWWDFDGFYEDPKVAAEAKLKMQGLPID